MVFAGQALVLLHPVLVDSSERHHGGYMEDGYRVERIVSNFRRTNLRRRKLSNDSSAGLRRRFRVGWSGKGSRYQQEVRQAKLCVVRLGDVRHL